VEVEDGTNVSSWRRRREGDDVQLEFVARQTRRRKTQSCRKLTDSKVDLPRILISLESLSHTCSSEREGRRGRKGGKMVRGRVG